MRKRIGTFILAFILTFLSEFQSYAGEISGDRGAVLKNTEDQVSLTESDVVFEEGEVEEVGGVEDGENNLDNSVIESEEGENSGQGQGEEPVQEPEEGENSGQGQGEEPVQEPEEGENSGQGQGEEPVQEPEEGENSEQGQGEEAVQEPEEENSEKNQEEELKENEVGNSDEGIDEEFEALNDPLYSRYMQMPVFIGEEVKSSSLVHDSRFDKYEKIQGIDVSKYQGDINWGAVKNSGVDFAMIRLGYRGMQAGTLQLDSQFTNNIEGAHAAGVQIGIYFFTQAVNTAEAEEEAQYVIDWLSQYPDYVSYPVIIDIEAAAGSRLDNAGLTANEKTAICRTFCEKIQRAGYTAGIYSNKNYLETQLNINELADSFYIWLAHYTNQTSYAGRYNMWQYTSSGTVSGISGYVDMDIAYISTAPQKVQGIKQTAATTDSITLSWNPVANADGYKVYRYNTSGTLVQSYNVTDEQTTNKNLEEGTTYQYKVRAFYLSADGIYTYGAYSDVYSAYTTPGQVENLTVEKQSENSITLSWKNLSGAVGYRVSIYNEDTKKYEVAATTTQNSYTVTGLSSGKNYIFKVQGYVNLNGSTMNKGVYSDTVSAYTIPAQITGLTKSAITGSSVILRWAKQTGITGYRVYCYDGNGALLSAYYTDTNSFTHSGVETGQSYQYRVRAYLSLNSDTVLWGNYSEILEVKTKPVQVSGLYESSAATDRIVVKWTAVEGADGYRVCLYDESTKKYTILGTTSSCSYTIKDLSPATRYNVRVAAYVKNGSKLDLGTYSSSLEATTKPTAVTGVKQTAKSIDSITITWNTLKNVDGYRVYCYDQDGKLLSSPYVEENMYTATDVSGKYIYKVRAYIKMKGYTAWGDYSSGLQVYTKPVQVSGLYESSAATDRIVVKWTAVEGADGYRVCLYDESTKKYTILGTTSSCSYTIKDLSPATRYNVRVAAYVKNGSKLDLGTYSSSLEATTKPTAVTGVKQTAKSIDSITITWNTLKNVDGYRVYCYDQDGKLLSSPYVEENMYTATDVSGKYIYKVRAYIKMKGYTAWGDYSSGLQVYTKPVQVSGLYESSAATDRIVVKWTAVEGADGYRVCLYDESTKKYTILGTTSSCSYTIKDLSPATRYNVRVAAYVKNGSKLDLGTYSSSLEATTKPTAVTGVKQTAKSIDSITITWNTLKNVDGYRVYCYDQDGKLLSSPYVEENMYTATDVSGKYIYKVRAYIKMKGYTAWGDYSSGLQVYTKPVQVSGLYESSAATDRIVVKWTAVEGADGYRVCLYDESTKKYTILGTTSSCSYTIKDLSPATRYNVRVAAYVKNGSKLDLGVYSPSLKAVTKPETVTNVKRTAMTADSITITWTALKNVSGYRVYCYDTNGKLLSSPYTTSNTYTVTGVSDEYVYRVRAYIKTEDYTAWGDYSKDDVDEKLEFQTGTLLQPSECTAVSYNGASLTVKIQTGRNSSLETLKGTYGIVLLNSAGTEMQEWKSGTVTNDNGFSVSAIFSSNDGFRMAAMGKFAIAVKNGSSVKVISDLEYLSNPDIFASKEESFKDKYMGYYEGYKITSKKGIQGASMSYTEDLRVQHVFLNVDIAEMVRESKTSGYVPYTYKGRTYYFQDLIALKDTIYDLHGWGSTDGNAYGENHIRAVTLNLLLSWDDTLSYLIHPSARVKGAASYYTLNMKEERARDTFEALFCYMGEELGQYKERVTNWTLGNEVNSCRVWNYSGAMSLEDCVENYAEAFQLLYQGVKRTAGSSRLFISLDHCWTTSDAGHSGKAYLDAFAAYMNETAPTMQWNVNYHSYSQPLSRNDFWNDYSNTTDSLNTKYISMRNIQVLTDYLGTLETKYGKANGSIRVIIGELGYSAAGGNTEQEDLQAAALGYGYYKAMFNTRIDAYIIRAYLDDPAETSSGLHLGLRRNDGAQTKKVAYDVYQNLDTNQSLNYMNKYLGIIGIGSWQSAISGFDASKLPASDF